MSLDSDRYRARASRRRRGNSGARPRARLGAPPGGLLGALVGLLLLVAAGAPLRAQSPAPLPPPAEASVGQRFLFALPDTARNFTGSLINGLPTDARVVLFASEPTVATVRGPGLLRTVTILPDRSTIVPLIDSTGSVFLDVTDRPRRTTYEITTDHPITATVFFTTIFGSEAFTPLPVASWGREYYPMLLPNQFLLHVGFYKLEELFGTADGPAEIIVIASQDGTTVDITPTGALRGPQARRVTLDAGEAYLIETDSSKVFDPVQGIDYVPPHDLAGTHITADKPIGIISGNTRIEGATAADSVRTPTGNTLRNTGIEWMAPVEMHGTSFSYRPTMPIEEEKTNELIRVLATSPGTTTVRLSTGAPPATLAQGDVLELRTRDVRGTDPPKAFAITTDRPAEAMLLTGNYARQTDLNGEAARTWAPAMTELVPIERWVAFARFHATLYPSFLTHYVVISAEPAARVWLDGREVSLEGGTPEAPYRHARVPVTTGDHTLRSEGGAFTAIAYGEAFGNEEFKPLKTKRKENTAGGVALGAGKDGSSLLHKSEYYEILAITYAAPVAGMPRPTAPPDSLEISARRECDSAVVEIRRVGADWSSPPLDLLFPPDSTNVVATVVDSVAGGIVVSYRIRLAPRDPSRDADGEVTIRSIDGSSWTIPYRRLARSLGIAPDPFALTGVVARRTTTTVVTITNRQSFPVTITGVGLAVGEAFTLGAHQTPPTTLPPGGSITIPVNFFGPAWETLFADTLRVTTDCGDQALPLSAETAPAGTRPIPEISGYDWRTRRVGSTNDTLSFITNSGKTPYDIREVLLLDDGGGAFTLVPPDWRPIGRVAPGDTGRTGIQFVPTTTGTFIGRIALISTDGDTATAPLHGVGVLPTIGFEDLSLAGICIDASTDTVLVVSNPGDLPLRVEMVTVTGRNGPADLLLNLAGIPFPVTLPPKGSLPIPATIVPNGAASGSFTLLARSDAEAGDSIASVEATFVRCERPRLVVDSIDIGTIWITLTGRGHLTLRNFGPGPARIDRIAMVSDTAGAFTISPPATPFTLDQGDTAWIPASFTPATVGLKTALVGIESEVGPLIGELRGTGARLIDTAFIRRDYHGASGDRVPIRIEMLHGLDTIAVDSLRITLGYDRQVLDFHEIGAAGPAGGRHSGLEREPDSLRFTLLVDRRPVTAGTLAEIDFLARLTVRESTELPFTIESPLPYVEIVELPGLFRLDPICGLSLRLFEWTTHLFRLEQNQPNPATGLTRIEFEIPTDGRATLVVYDMLGAERLRLVDETLAAGTYVAVIPAGGLPSGAYEYRLVTGNLQASRRMVIR